MKQLPLEMGSPGLQRRKVYKVSELALEIKSALQKRFFDIWVEGEVSDFKRSSAGHLYMRLKDEKAQIKAIMFRNKAIFLRFMPENGLAVIARGSVSTYPQSSEYELILDYLEPKGVGALQLAFEQLKAKLAAEGLFDPARKKPIPKLPRTIGVITSPTGAAIRDILNVTRRRFCSAHIILFPVQVQGDKAPGEIVFAIDEMNRLGLADVLIVGRGGGAAIDLWAFNDESVARAIARSSIPIISAVGHEIDFTIADFVADVRAPTPSAAAELVVQSRAELLSRNDSLRGRLVRTVLDRIAFLTEQHRRFATSLRLNSPERAIQLHMQRLDELETRVGRAAGQIVRARDRQLSNLTQRLVTLAPTERFAAAAGLLQGYNRRLMAAARRFFVVASARQKALNQRLVSLMPHNVLKRGYALCQDSATGKPVARTTDTRVGANILVLLSDGNLGCYVNDISRSAPGDADQ